MNEKDPKLIALQFNECINKQDLPGLSELMTEDHTFVDRNGKTGHPTNRIVQEKAELLKLIREGIIRYTRFERRPEKFLFYEDLVVVMGDETVVPGPGTPNEGTVLRRRSTNAWIRHDGKWRLAFRHANNVQDPSGK